MRSFALAAKLPMLALALAAAADALGPKRSRAAPIPAWALLSAEAAFVRAGAHGSATSRSSSAAGIAMLAAPDGDDLLPHVAQGSSIAIEGEGASASGGENKKSWSSGREVLR
jgi:hypothetical protein